MSFESTPGVSTRVVQHPKRDGVEPHDETIFVFDLSKMTLATALANPKFSDAPMSEWTIEQLFQVMLEPRDPPKGSSSYGHKKDIEELRPLFIQHVVSAIDANPLNDAIAPFAARRDPESRAVVAYRSTYTNPKNPDRVSKTVLHVSTDATIYQLSGILTPKRRVRDDLFKPRHPDAGFIKYIVEFRRLRLDPLQNLIAKNDADVHKAIAAMAHVQQINVALSFVKDCSLVDRSVVWRDFFEHWEPSGFFEKQVSQAMWEERFWHDEALFKPPLHHKQLAQLRDFREKQLDPLIEELGKAAVWARAAQTDGVKVCASAKKRDDEAERLLQLLRMNDVILDALDQWDDLGVLEGRVLRALLNDVFAALAQCPGATASLLESEFLAVARGADSVVQPIPTLPRDSPRQKALADAITAFDATAALGTQASTPLTKVIEKAFKRYQKTRKIAPSIVSLWAHSCPAILARFDKLEPGRINVDGTAYLSRSVFGMGLMSPAEMKTLFSDLDLILDSAVKHGVTHKQTKARLERMFEKDFSHGKYPVRLNWIDGNIFNSIKLAVGVLGVRQAFISASDGKTLPAEAFVDLSVAVLNATGAVSELRPALKSIFSSGRSAVHHQPSFLDKLPPAAKLAQITALVSVVSNLQKASTANASSIEGVHANADVAVAYLSLMVVIYEAALGTTFPIAGLALILMRWVLFDEDLWNMIGGVTSASPMVKVVRGMMDAIEDEKGKIGKLLRQAPNWGKIRDVVEDVRALAPASIEASEEAKYVLYFHLETSYDGPVRQYANRSYGLSDDIAALIIEN